MSDKLEILWNGLLSRESERIRTTFDKLNTEQQEAVLAHLRRMAEEEGWHHEQKLSARIALRALDEYENGYIRRG